MSTNRLTQLLAFLEESPNDAFLLFALAKEYEKLGEEQQAFIQYEKLVETQADYVGTYYHFGKWYERAQQSTEAIARYEQGAMVARQAGDQHALSELLGAKNLLIDEMED